MAPLKPHQDRDALLKKREALLDELKALDRQLEQGTAPTPQPSRRGLPVREAILDALEELGVMAYSRELVLYVKARYGRDVAPARFGTLDKDEQNAFDNGRPKAVFLCHGITSDRFEGIKRLWARSDWPLEARIVAPTTGRIQHLRITAQLCRIAKQEAVPFADPETLRFIAADHARDLPGVRLKRGEFDLDGWRELASEELEKFEPNDLERRREAAGRLRALPERDQLFGAPDRPALFEVPRRSLKTADDGECA
jgi:hypothetical protein